MRGRRIIAGSFRHSRLLSIIYAEYRIACFLLPSFLVFPLTFLHLLLERHRSTPPLAYLFTVLGLLCHGGCEPMGWGATFAKSTLTDYLPQDREFRIHSEIHLEGKKGWAKERGITTKRPLCSTRESIWRADALDNSHHQSIVHILRLAPSMLSSPQNHLARKITLHGDLTSPDIYIRDVASSRNAT